jgi:pimeloyl-ACP methyl ester carboxylesterase
MGDLIDALGFSGPVDLMGYHTGSKIAVELALLRPLQVRRVVMISAPILTESEREAMRAHYGRRTPSADGSHLAEQWRRFLHYHLYGEQTIEDAADAFPDILLGRSREWWGHRAAFNHYLDRRLPLLSQPLLVFNTDDDLWTVTRRAAPYLNNGLIVELPGWGHGFLDSATAPAAALTRSFLDAPDAAPFATLVPPPPPATNLSPGHFASIPGQKLPA